MQGDLEAELGLPPTPRMLVLSGPPGSGKGTQGKMLAEAYAALADDGTQHHAPNRGPWHRNPGPRSDGPWFALA